jgi:hypothetical protein
LIGLQCNFAIAKATTNNNISPVQDVRSVRMMPPLEAIWRQIAQSAVLQIAQNPDFAASVE